MWRARIEDHRLLADFYFAVLEAAGALVHVQDSTGTGLLCIDKPEAARDCAFAEQALAGADDHRELPDTKRVDQIVKTAVRMLEPILLLTFASVVALVAAALLQAIYSVRPTA